MDDKLQGTTRKLVAHTRPQKDSKNVRNCLRLLNEAGENVPWFVSHHLDELPRVTFNSLDVSCLLGKIKQLGADITNMKQAVSLETKTCNDLRIITADINQHMGAFEQTKSGERAYFPNQQACNKIVYSTGL